MKIIPRVPIDKPSIQTLITDFSSAIYRHIRSACSDDGYKQWTFSGQFRILYIEVEVASGLGAERMSDIVLGRAKKRLNTDHTYFTNE